MLDRLKNFVNENVSKENIKRSGWGIASFCLGTKTAQLAVSSIAYSADLISAYAIPIINGTPYANQTEMALGAIKVTAEYSGHLAVNLMQYSLICAGILLTGYCIARVVDIPHQDKKETYTVDTAPRS